jgi:hypothetical protein
MEIGWSEVRHRALEHQTPGESGAPLVNDNYAAVASASFSLTSSFEVAGE